MYQKDKNDSLETSGEQNLEKEVMEGRIEGKRGRGQPRIMMLDNIIAHEACEKIKRITMGREYWRNSMPRTCFIKNANDDIQKSILSQKNDSFFN